eukprot:COSAG05_NODE_19854_length_287_cov_0.308511_1_plen_68_part_10
MCKEAAEIATSGGSTKRLYQIAKILSKRGKGRSSNAQPEVDAMSYTNGTCSFDSKATTKLNTAAEKAS